LALDISKITDVKDYEKKVEEIIDEIKSSKLAEGADGIFYPGEKERIAQLACIEKGEIENRPKPLKILEKRRLRKQKKREEKRNQVN